MFYGLWPLVFCHWYHFFPLKMIRNQSFLIFFSNLNLWHLTINKRPFESKWIRKILFLAFRFIFKLSKNILIYRTFNGPSSSVFRNKYRNFIIMLWTTDWSMSFNLRLILPVNCCFSVQMEYFALLANLMFSLLIVCLLSPAKT